MSQAPANARRRLRILGLGGSGREGSTCDRALAMVLAEAERQGAELDIFSGQLLDLPHYDFARGRPGLAAMRLLDAVRQADGIIIATPSYHGGISGAVKGALDHLEELREAERPYLEGRAVGLVVSAHGAQALGTTLMALRGVVHALRGWPTPYGMTINSREAPLGAQGEESPAYKAAAASLAAQVIAFAQAANAVRQVNAA